MITLIKKLQLINNNYNHNSKNSNNNSSTSNNSNNGNSSNNYYNKMCLIISLINVQTLKWQYFYLIKIDYKCTSGLHISSLLIMLYLYIHT